MKKNRLFILVVAYLLMGFATATATPHPPTQLSLSEGFDSPLGFYDATPTFSWQLPRNIQAQSAYQVQVYSSNSVDKQNLIWDSGRVSSDNSAWAGYTGTALKSRSQFSWRVKVWGQEAQASRWSALKTAEMGLLENSDWTAKWIGLPEESFKNKSRFDITLHQPTYLRKLFSLPQNVKSARLYITSLGIFEARLNGDKVGTDFMTPGWTPYETKVETLTYDVTSKLKSGDNSFAIALASGWYSGRLGYSRKDHWKENPPPRALAQLEYELTDGTKGSVVTDGSWKATNQGPITKSSIYDGEDYVQQQSFSRWAHVDFDDSKWQPVITQAIAKKPLLQPKRHHTVKEITRITPLSVTKKSDGKIVFDMGQNMVGVPHLRVPIKKGATLTLRFAEMLTPEGEIYTKNYRSAQSTNTYTATEDHITDWRPTFTFHGYRYLELSGFDATKTADLGWVDGVVLHSNFEDNGSFSSSVPKLNKLQSNITWGLRGNFLDIPTDCPQRDERLGWTGDAQVFAPTSLFNASTHSFWSSWLESMRLEQEEDGGINVFIPSIPHHKRIVSPGWFDAGTIIPWDLYFRTGDKEVLKENFSMMMGVVRYYQNEAKDHTVNTKGFGDWLQPYPVRTEDTRRGDTAMPLIATAFYARSVELTMRAAKELGKTDEANTLASLHAKIKQAFQARFFDSEAQITEGLGTQTAYLLALNFELLTGEIKNKAQKRLLATIDAAGDHLRTGFLGTPLLAPVLDSMGETDLMYRLLFKETYPSWFYSINQGATTMWERWDSFSYDEGFHKQGMNSFNHYAYGAIGQWMYERVGGIAPLSPGYKKIGFAPAFSGPLDHAQVSYKSPYGTIRSSWKKTKGSVQYTIVVPPNSTGEVVIPASKDEVTEKGVKLSKVVGVDNIQSTDSGVRITVLPGKYTFEFMMTRGI